MEYKYYATCTRNDLDCTGADVVLATNDFMRAYSFIMHSLRADMRYAFNPMPGEEPRIIRWKIETATGHCLFGFKLMQFEDLTYSVRVFRHPCASAPGMKVMYWMNH